MALRTTNLIPNKNGRHPAFSSRYKVKKMNGESKDTDVLIQYFINEVRDENDEIKGDSYKFIVEVLKSDKNQFDDDIQKDEAMKAKLDAMTATALQIEAAMATAAALSNDTEIPLEDEIVIKDNVAHYEREAINYGKLAETAEKKVTYLENAMKLAKMTEENEQETMKAKLAEISAAAANKAASLEASMASRIIEEADPEEAAMKTKLAEISAAAAKKAAALGTSFF